MTQIDRGQSSAQAAIPVAPVGQSIKTQAGKAWADVVLCFAHGTRGEYRAALRRYNAICQPQKEAADGR